MRQAFGETIYHLGSLNPDLYVVDIDLKSSLFLDKFANKFRSRFIECGVAENNAAGVAAGLAKAGKTVFLTSFACFSPGLNWNTIKQSICYNHLNVKVVGSHAGLMSTDLGATHQMLEDVSLMRSLPTMEVFAPVDALETEKIITILSRSRQPAYIRLVRPETASVFTHSPSFTVGKSHIIKPGKDITFLSYGPLVHSIIKVQASLDIDLKSKSPSLEIINCSSIKPLDSDSILKSLKKTNRLIVLEDHQRSGGLGEAVAALVLESGINCKFVHLAVNNLFGQSAKDYNQLYDYYGIGQKNIVAAIKKIL